MKRTLIALFALVSLGVTTFAANPALAQDKMSGGKMAGGKMAATKPTTAKTAPKSVYVCKTCKTYFSATDAAKMKYKDSMGHKLTKMDKAPTGYKDGTKTAMDKGGKMGGKMSGGKM